jgi:hypothetical protein
MQRLYITGTEQNVTGKEKGKREKSGRLFPWDVVQLLYSDTMWFDILGQRGRGERASVGGILGGVTDVMEPPAF